MATATKNTQAFASFDIERLKHLSDDELRDYANDLSKLYASLDGGVRRRTPHEAYIVGATFRVLKSRTPHGQWQASLKEMRLKSRTIQRLMYVAKGVDYFNLDVEVHSSTDEIIDYIRSLRG